MKNKTFQEKLADIIIDAIVPPAGERAGETEIRTLQAITALIESDLIGEDIPTDMFGSWTRRKDGTMIPLSDEIIITNNLNARQRSILRGKAE